jgi:lipopolysaccharide export system permease protein
MRILNRYIITDYLAIFAMALVTFTFVMYIGAIVKAIDLLTRGVPGAVILRVFWLNIPFTLSFAIPVSVLVAALLLFGRLSFDGEITALRAGGLSMWQIVSPVICLSIFFMVFCLYLNGTAMPRSHYAQRQMLSTVHIEDPLVLLEEGRFTRDFPGMIVYIGKKKDRQVKDVVAYELGPRGPVRNVRARSGDFAYDKTSRVLTINLYDVRIEQPDPEAPNDLSKTRVVDAGLYPVKLDFTQLVGSGHVTKKAPDLTYTELLRAIADVRKEFPELKPEDVERQRMKLITDANQRLGLSVACFAFTLLAIPLALKSRRHETSIGVILALAMVFIFYMFIVITDALVAHPRTRPDLLVWLPLVLAQIAGLWMIFRSDFRGG